MNKPQIENTPYGTHLFLPACKKLAEDMKALAKEHENDKSLIEGIPTCEYVTAHVNDILYILGQSVELWEKHKTMPPNDKDTLVTRDYAARAIAVAEQRGLQLRRRFPAAADRKR
jgi:hypothetical protein